ncbi:serine--tRNA ligase [Candidatus Palibaumannia cicadellinicola]|uniref:Serine--tRNA ligase n=1 Tax=Candidatus Palibaumannia cicadellinicola TaxID=186490 RepID=A0A0K2BLD2_9GAMM|nr:serine--tRNA ligase [Candidatus Baumannia cicadellinicola]AKZ65863.1 Seryl-tRNA synthetase [Candidatus Baumannia cicadellinicola]
MIDMDLLRYDIINIAKKLNRRKFLLDTEQFSQQEKLRKTLQTKKEQLQAERNYKSKIINYNKDLKLDISIICKQVSKINQQLKIIKLELDSLRNKINESILVLPNIPADDVPDGENYKDNIEVLRWGEQIKYYFPIRDHVDLGLIHDGIDFTAGVKLAGSRFVVMRGQIACLHRALSQFMLDLHTQQHGYQEYALPYLVNQTSLYGTGHLPKFTNDLFHIKPLHKENTNNFYTLIPTAEVPLINLLRSKIFDEEMLPLKMTAHTSCFRSEVGSYGKDTRGLIRMHQFDKVELVQVTTPEQSMQALENMTGHAEQVLQLLNLPYRKILLCTGDLGFASCKTYDLEVWCPAQNTYREVSSCSNISDFQARRILARFRSNKSKKLKFLHTLNGSGLAVGRTLIAVLENYQLSDGRIKIPVKLVPYMKGLDYIG